ncbi:hypothetical protein SC1_04352 [Sphingopyxis sp. C-1]|nr:hypothetical protein SC1_04352 [Sphingopyxis sp. C-1]
MALRDCESQNAAPIMAAYIGAGDVERVQKRNNIADQKIEPVIGDGSGSRGSTIASQIGCDQTKCARHAIRQGAPRCGMVGKTVEKQHGWPAALLQIMYVEAVDGNGSAFSLCQRDTAGHIRTGHAAAPSATLR